MGNHIGAETPVDVRREGLLLTAAYIVGQACEQVRSFRSPCWRLRGKVEGEIQQGDDDSCAIGTTEGVEKTLARVSRLEREARVWHYELSV